MEDQRVYIALYTPYEQRPIRGLPTNPGRIKDDQDQNRTSISSHNNNNKHCCTVFFANFNCTPYSYQHDNCYFSSLLSWSICLPAKGFTFSIQTSTSQQLCLKTMSVFVRNFQYITKVGAKKCCQVARVLM